MINEELLNKMENALKECNIIYSELEEKNLLNEQKALDWLDDLNALSVQY